MTLSQDLDAPWGSQHSVDRPQMVELPEVGKEMNL